MHQRLDLIDFLVIAERITGVDARILRLNPDLIRRADSAMAAPFASWMGVEVYPGLHEKAAIYGSRIIRNHPLIDGNKRTARVVMREFVARNGGTWVPDPVWGDEAEVIEQVADRSMTEGEFMGWISKRIIAP